MRASLGGVLIDATQDVSWSLTSGVRAHQQLFLVTAGDAEKLLARDGPVSLVIESPDYPRLEVRDLWIMSVQAASTPAQRLVLVADKRIWWSRFHVLRRFNVTKRGPDTRRLYQEGTPVGFNRTIVSDQIYAPWSLYPREKPSAPWTAQQALLDVIEAVDSSPVRFDATFDRSASIQNLVVDDQGDTAIAQVLKFVPGAMIHVARDGTIVIGHENKGGELGGTAAKLPPIVGPPLATVVSLARSRPAAIDVLFGRELEVRFDSRVEGVLSTRATEARDMINVAPVPDSVLRVNGKLLTCGTWCSFDNLFTAWAGTWGSLLGDLTHAYTQKLFPSPSFIDAYARPVGSTTVDPILVRRISAITQHYRQTYQLEPRWRDKILSLRAYRVGILDEENGVRAAAQAFSDWSIQPTLRGSAKVQKDHSFFAYNVAGYADLLVNAKVAPARVTVQDEDQGVIRLDYLLDQNGLYARVFPCGIVGPDGSVNSLPRADARPVGGLNYMAAHAILAPSHRVAVVLTAVPAAPNDERQLYRHRVEKSDAEAALGLGIGECRGPVWKVRVSDALLQARWEWRDDKASAVEDVFGVTSAPPPKAGAVGSGNPPADPLGDPANNVAVRACAEAVAAAIYSAFLDRGEGTHATAISPETHPTGSISTVTHVLRTDGSALTLAYMPGRAEPVDLLAFLPESVRSLLQRIVK